MTMATNEREIIPIKKLCHCGCGRYLPDYVITLHLGKEGDSIEEWLQDQGLTIEQVRERNNTPDRVEIRRRVVRWLREHSWSLTRIGTFIDRDHTTVRNLLMPRRK